MIPSHSLFCSALPFNQVKCYSSPAFLLLLCQPKFSEPLVILPDWASQKLTEDTEQFRETRQALLVFTVTMTHPSPKAFTRSGPSLQVSSCKEATVLAGPEEN